MSDTPQRRELLDLLPAVYRERDSAGGGGDGFLERLLDVVGAQLDLVQNDLAQLYDDLFVETCDPWVLPYIGDLVAVTPGAPVADDAVLTTAEVTNAIRLRRRKGTAAVLEQLAYDRTGWPALAVEMFERLTIAQHLQHVVPTRGRTASLRAAGPLENLGRSFDSSAHTAEVRRIGSGRGRYNVPNVAIFVWRDQPVPHTWSDAAPIDDRRFRVHPLGIDVRLCTKDVPELRVDHRAGVFNVPASISRRQLAAHLPDYYGVERSMAVRLPGDPDPIDVDDIVVCDLSDTAPDGSTWSNVSRLTASQVGVDPELGRLAFGTAPVEPPLTLFFTSQPSDTGGSEVRPRPRTPESDEVGRVRRDGADGTTTTLAAALDGASGARTVRIEDSRTYQAPATARVPARSSLRIVSADDCHPVIEIQGGAFEVTIGELATLDLFGLILTGGPVIVRGRPARVRVEDCILVPGGTVDAQGVAPFPISPSIVFDLDNDWQTELIIENCVTGPLHVPFDGTTVAIADSILDSVDQGLAFAAGASGAYGAALSMTRCTVLGAVSAASVGIVRDTIVTGALRCDRRQIGCLEYSWLGVGSATPRRHECQPADASTPPPRFVSTRFGSSGYGRLRRTGAGAVIRSASDGYEMGAMARLRQTQRDDNLRRGIAEFLRFGLEAGVLDGT